MKYEHSRLYFNEENPVLYNFKNRVFVSQVTAGIRCDINVKEMIVFIQKVEEFCTTLQEGEAFIHFTKNSPIRIQVQSLISQNLQALKSKQAELAAIFDLGNEWVEKTFRKNVSDVSASNPFVPVSYTNLTLRTILLV